jgi:hypothetical protein
MKILGLVLTLAALSAVSACEEAPEVAPTESAAAIGTPVEGVWRIAERITADTAVAPLINPPSLYIFAGNHYSIMYVVGELPRPVFAAVDPTDAEKLTAFDTFIANSGTYELTGNTIEITPIVAKTPNYMGGGQDQFEFRVLADTLWLTSSGSDLRFVIGGQLVPPSGVPVEATFKLIRVQ